MQEYHLAQSLILSELKLLSLDRQPRRWVADCVSRSSFGVCPGCASQVRRIYDHRVVMIRDARVRDMDFWLRIKKRRFHCTCGKIFTEYIEGISVKARTTERFKRYCVALAKSFSSLAQVSQSLKCSHGYVQKALYADLRIKALHHKQQIFPKAIGLDEHSFKRGKFGRMEFVTVVTSPRGQKRRLLDVTRGKSSQSLWEGLQGHQGREGVELVVIDMSKAYRKFAKEFFCNAELVADKFHVIRLLAPVVMKYRYLVTARRADRVSKAKILKDFNRLSYPDRIDLKNFLSRHDALHRVWEYYQAIMRLYRTRGAKRAQKAFEKITDKLKEERLPELKRFRRTLIEWKTEILNYFKYRLTNARAEGFNNKAKVLKKRAYGYRNFFNYRLRILTT